MLTKISNSSTLIIIVLLLFQGLIFSEEILSHSDFLMDTYVTIQVVVSDKITGKKVLDDAFELMKKLDKKFNNYNPDSELSHINHNAFNLEIKIDEEMLRILEASKKIFKISNGAFDPTVSPLVKLWNFKAEKPSVPSQSTITNLLPLVNFNNVMIDEKKKSVHFLKNGMEIDLGAIAKGFVVDEVADFLKKRNIKSALINAGGNIYAYGKKPDNTDWKVGLKDPRGEGIIATLPLRDKSIATSGDYERFFIIEGKRYHHILNPKTGYPVDETISMSVIAKDATTADGLSTAAFVKGGQKALEFIKNLGRDDIEGIVIFPENNSSFVGDANMRSLKKYKILVTEKLAKDITIIEKNSDK